MSPETLARFKSSRYNLQLAILQTRFLLQSVKFAKKHVYSASFRNRQ